MGKLAGSPFPENAGERYIRTSDDVTPATPSNDFFGEKAQAWPLAKCSLA
jgi:hypothetical protein